MKSSWNINGFIYLVHIHGDLYKVGRSKNALQRLRHYKAAIPFARMLCCVEVNHVIQVESLILITFADKKKLEGGKEWFCLNEDIVNVFPFIIESLQDVVNNMHNLVCLIERDNTYTCLSTEINEMIKENGRRFFSKCKKWEIQPECDVNLVDLVEKVVKENVRA